MNTIIGICMVICMAVMLVGGLMMLAAAFRVGILWGVAYLLVPLAALVFLFKHWTEAKKGFLINMAGLGVFLGLYFIFPQGRPAIAEWAVNHSGPSANALAPKQNDYSTEIAAKREHLLTLQADLARVTADTDLQFKALTERRTALNTTDQPAVHQFNVDAVAYQKEAEQMKQLAQEIDATNLEVEELLAKRAAEKKQVVIYSTSWCSVCQQAKQYMKSKGINYREVDVEKSREGADEYRRQGGDGAVPLIVVGDKKMRGFNASELDSML